MEGYGGGGSSKVKEGGRWGEAKDLLANHLSAAPGNY